MRTNSMWSFIFLTIILYETRCAESTKPLEFLSSLISKCFEFKNQLILGIEQAKEENHNIYQINVSEDGEYILTNIENEEEISNTTPIVNTEITTEPTTTEKTTTTEEPTTTVNPRTTVEQVTTIKMDAAVQPINFEKPIIKPIQFGTVILRDSTSNSNYPPATISQNSYQVLLPQKNAHFYPISYSNWHNNYPLSLNQPGGYQPNNKYLPYPSFIPMANPNIYGSKTLTHNDVPYTETQHQNFGMYYPPTIQQIDYTIRPKLTEQGRIHSTYRYPKPIYQPYPISSYIAPQMASLKVQSKIVLPRSYSVKTMEPTTVFSTKRGHSFQLNL